MILGNLAGDGRNDDLQYAPYVDPFGNLYFPYPYCLDPNLRQYSGAQNQGSPGVDSGEADCCASCIPCLTCFFCSCSPEEGMIVVAKNLKHESSRDNYDLNLKHESSHDNYDLNLKHESSRDNYDLYHYIVAMPIIYEKKVVISVNTDIS